MSAEACTATQVFSVKSTFSVLMSGDVKTTKQYNFCKNNLDCKTKSSLKTFNQLRNQVEENTIPREASSEIYVPQYFKQKCKCLS